MCVCARPRVCIFTLHLTDKPASTEFHFSVPCFLYHCRTGRFRLVAAACANKPAAGGRKLAPACKPDCKCALKKISIMTSSFKELFFFFGWLSHFADAPKFNSESSVSPASSTQARRAELSVPSPAALLGEKLSTACERKDRISQ